MRVTRTRLRCLATNWEAACQVRRVEPEVRIWDLGWTAGVIEWPDLGGLVAVWRLKFTEALYSKLTDAMCVSRVGCRTMAGGIDVVRERSMEVGVGTCTEYGNWDALYVRVCNMRT